MLRYRDPAIGGSLGARGYRTSWRVKRHGSQKQGSLPVAGNAARPSELPQKNRDVLKKLREMKLGAHIDCALLLYRPTWGKVLSHDCGLKHARFGPIPKTFCTNFRQCHA
jgi:hypothetical protein